MTEYGLVLALVVLVVVSALVLFSEEVLVLYLSTLNDITSNILANNP